MKEIHLIEKVRTENLKVITITNEELFKEEMTNILKNKGRLDYDVFEDSHLQSCSVSNYDHTEDNFNELQQEFRDIINKEYGI
jgi:hypothetical protein